MRRLPCPLAPGGRLWPSPQLLSCLVRSGNLFLGAGAAKRGASLSPVPSDLLCTNSWTFPMPLSTDALNTVLAPSALIPLAVYIATKHFVGKLSFTFFFIACVSVNSLDLFNLGKNNQHGRLKSCTNIYYALGCNLPAPWPSWRGVGG